MGLVVRTSICEFGVGVGRDTIQSIAGITGFLFIVFWWITLFQLYPSLSGERWVKVEVSVPANYQVVVSKPGPIRSSCHIQPKTR